jgi:hypothetical protein
MPGQPVTVRNTAESALPRPGSGPGRHGADGLRDRHHTCPDLPLCNPTAELRPTFARRSHLADCAFDGKTGCSRFSFRPARQVPATLRRSASWACRPGSRLISRAMRTGGLIHRAWPPRSSGSRAAEALAGQVSARLEPRSTSTHTVRTRGREHCWATRRVLINRRSSIVGTEVTGPSCRRQQAASPEMAPACSLAALGGTRRGHVGPYTPPGF